MNFTPRQILIRVLLSILAGLLTAALISEGAHILLKEPQDRGPQRIELIIPPGAAQMVAAGKPVTSIPEEMIFVQGDTLVVINHDATDHQLGPIWVPAGSTSSLVLDQANLFSYACTFQPTRYLGLDVREPITWKTRLLGIIMIGLPTAALYGGYSFVVFPARKKDPDAPEEG
ncbi:MAG TPA: hypothetical protein VHO48_05225 [Anaerolineaceae bacterium]|nr:hypothetical protein [Anaerolineaceae bacterium]